MSLIERIADNIGKRTRYILDFDDDNEEIVIYGAINLIQTTISFFVGNGDWFYFWGAL